MGEGPVCGWQTGWFTVIHAVAAEWRRDSADGWGSPTAGPRLPAFRGRTHQARPVFRPGPACRPPVCIPIAEWGCHSAFRWRTDGVAKCLWAARTVQDTDDFERTLVGAVHDEVVVDQPEQHQLVREVSSKVSHARHLGESVTRVEDVEEH